MNIDLIVFWVFFLFYIDKLSVIVVFGELFKMFVVLELKVFFIINVVCLGMFWELGLYFENYLNLSKMFDVVLSNLFIDNKIYGLYCEWDIV